MYFNDVHILYYAVVAILGGILGQFIDYCSKCFINDKKILKKESFKEYRKKSLPNYILILGIACIYIGLVYKFGIDTTNLIKNIDLIKYIVLIPMLACAFMVDFKIQIIPNRLNLLMFEMGLVFVFLYGFSNINLSFDMLLGMLAGGGIFLVITLIRRANCRKRSNGYAEMLN